MKNRKKICTAEDVYEHFDVTDAVGLTRSLYKYTDCGAYGHVSAPGTVYNGTRKQTWVAHFRDVGDGWKLLSVRQKGHAPGRTPAEVLQYFNVERGYWRGDSADIRSITSEGPYGIKRVRYVGRDILFTAHVDITQYRKHSGYFVVGSCIEGSAGPG